MFWIILRHVLSTSIIQWYAFRFLESDLIIWFQQQNGSAASVVDQPPEVVNSVTCRTLGRYDGFRLKERLQSNTFVISNKSCQIWFDLSLKCFSYIDIHRIHITIPAFHIRDEEWSLCVNWNYKQKITVYLTNVDIDLSRNVRYLLGMMVLSRFLSKLSSRKPSLSSCIFGTFALTICGRKYM